MKKQVEQFWTLSPEEEKEVSAKVQAISIKQQQLQQQQLQQQQQQQQK